MRKQQIDAATMVRYAAKIEIMDAVIMLATKANAAIDLTDTFEDERRFAEESACNVEFWNGRTLTLHNTVRLQKQWESFARACKLRHMFKISKQRRIK